MSGKLYAVGVGPGDPDLMTLKAIKTIKNADCIACPESHGEPGMAYEIAKETVPEITSKELLLLEFPMRKDDLFDAHRKAAEQIIYYLSSGKYCEFDGTLVIMKAGKKLKEITEKAFARNKHIYLVENIGMPDEKIYFESQSFPDEAGYFSLVIVK